MWDTGCEGAPVHLGKLINCRLGCCPLNLSARSSAAEGIKLVGKATAVTTGGRGLEARVRTEPHVRSGEPAKCLLSRKTAGQEHGGVWIFMSLSKDTFS